MTLIPAKTTDSTYEDPTVAQLGSANGFSATDDGRMTSLMASAKYGFKNNITGVTARWLKYKLDGNTGDPVTQEEYEQSNAAVLGIPFEGQTKTQLDYQFLNKMEDMRLQDQMEGQERHITNFVGGLGGGLLDPIGFLVPPAKATKVNLLLRAGHAAKAGTVATTSTFKNLLTYNTLLEAPYGAMKQDMGEDYGLEHVKASLLFNPVFSGVFAGARGYNVYRKGKKIKQAQDKAKAFTDFMNGQRVDLLADNRAVFVGEDGRVVTVEIGGTDLSEMVRIVQDSGNPALRALIDENPRLKDIADGKVKDSEYTYQDNIDIAAIMHMNEVGAKLNIMSKKLADDYLKLLDSGVKIKDAYADYEARVQRLTEAITTGNLKKLTPEDIEWLKFNANIFVRRNTRDKKPKGTVYLEEGIGLQTKGAARAAYYSTMEAANLQGKDDFYTLIRDELRALQFEMQYIKDGQDMKSDLRDYASPLRYAQITLSHKVLDARNMPKLLLDAAEAHGVTPQNAHIKLNDKATRDAIAETFDIRYQRQLKKIEANYARIMRKADEIFPDHQNVIDDAHGLIKKIFLKDAELPRATGVLAKTYDEYYEFVREAEFKGAVGFLDGKMAIAPRGVFYQGFAGVPKNFQNGSNYISEMFQLMTHEHVHQMKIFARYYWDKLFEIANQDKIRKILERDILEKYERVWLEDEMPSVLIEWAMTRREFWDALKKADPELYKMFGQYVDEMISNFAFQLDVTRVADDGNLSLRQALDAEAGGDIAAKIGDIMGFYRSEASFGNFYGSLGDQPRTIDFSVENLNTVLRSKLQPSYKNPNFPKRAKKQEAYNADPAGYLENKANEILGDEAVLPILVTIPKGITKTGARKTHIAETEEKLRELGFDELAFVYADILTNLQASKARLRLFAANLRTENSLTDPLFLEQLDKAGVSDEMVARLGYIFNDTSLSASEKHGRMMDYFKQEDLGMIVRTVHDISTRNSLKNLAKKHKNKKTQLAQIKTVLDGNLRAGVQRVVPIQRLVDVQVQKDQGPIIDYLGTHDLIEIFFGEDNRRYLSKYFGDGSSEDSRIYSEDLIEASKLFHIDVMNQILTGEVPAKFKGLKKFENFAEIIKTVNKGQLGEVNALGVNVKQSADFAGYSVTYHRDAVLEMGLEKFIAFMSKAVDLEKTVRLHGGVMKDKSGKLVPFNFNALMKGMYNSIDDGTFIDDGSTAGKSIIGAMRKSSKIAFKPEYKAEAIVRFGNYKNMGRMLMEQIRARAEKIALIRHLGHDPYNNLLKTVGELNLASTPGIATFRMTAKQLTGLLDDPVNETIAKNFQTVRKISNIANLGGAGFSALSDIPLTLTTLQYLGVDIGFTDFVKAYKQAISTQFGGNNKEMAAWFRAQGAAFDLLLRQMAARVATGESTQGGISGVGNDITFEVNGLQRITATHQQIFIDYITSEMAAQLKTLDPDSTLLNRLREFGFTTTDFKRLQKAIQKTPDGIERLTPTAIVNEKLQEKTRGFILHFMKEAVMEPDVGAQAITRMGLEAGTYQGEVIRTAFQYSSFMLGMGRVVYRRFLHGYQGEGKHNAYRMSHLIAYLGVAIAFAYMTTVMKDLAKFKEPINLFDMTQFDFNRIISQSGILSIGDLGFNAMRFNDPTAFFAPVVGQVASLLGGDPSDAFESYTGQNYPVIGPVIQQAIGFVAGETVNSIQKDYVSYMRGLSDKALDTQIDALERAGALRLVQTSEGPKLLATSEEGATAVQEKKRRMALDTVNP